MRKWQESRGGAGPGKGRLVTSFRPRREEVGKWQESRRGGIGKGTPGGSLPTTLRRAPPTGGREVVGKWQEFFFVAAWWSPFLPAFEGCNGEKKEGGGVEWELPSVILNFQVGRLKKKN